MASYMYMGYTYSEYILLVNKYLVTLFVCNLNIIY